MHPSTYGLKPLDHSGATPPADQAPLTRRHFIAASLASGFALASEPLFAQAIRTDSAGLLAGEIRIPVAGGDIPAYRAVPAGKGPFPVVVVVQEIFGVHEYIQDVCRRLAKRGYYAVAPDLFVRHGDVSAMTDIPAILKDVVSRVPDAQVMADIDATVAHVTTDRRAKASRLGIIGFCWGGRTVWLYAQHNPKVKAGVAYYGLLDGMKSDIKPVDPVDIGATLKVPVLGLYAGMDGFVPAATVDRMRSEIDASGSGSQIIVFPNVNHGFHADYRPTYNAAAAQYGWKLTLDWLKERGV